MAQHQDNRAIETKWQYAHLYYHGPSSAFGGEREPAAGFVEFTHSASWELAEDEYWPAVRRLGDEGWELVTETFREPKPPFGSYSRDMHFKRVA